MTCPFKPTCEAMYECASCKTIGHKEWCGIRCAEDGCGTCTCRAYEPFDIRPRRPIGLWTTRTTSSGRFEEAKASGDVFAGVRKDDALIGLPDDLTDWWPFRWLRGRGYDNLHITLGTTALLGILGLSLHAMGVFVP